MKAIRAWFLRAIFLLLSGRLKFSFPFSEHLILQSGFSKHVNNGSPSKYCSIGLLAVLTAANSFQICQIQMSKGISWSGKLSLPRKISIPVFTIHSKYFTVSFNGMM